MMTRLGKVRQLAMFTDDEVLPLWTATAQPVGAEVLARCRGAAQMVLRALRAQRAYPALASAPADMDKKGGQGQ